jgi:hypothetical protein
MATMRPLLRRVELNWIGFLLLGALCGALVMFGVDTLRQSSHEATAPPVAAPVPAANSVPIGGRLGGMVSSDTATGWYLQREFNPDDALSTSVAAPVGKDLLGQRESSVSTAGSQRIVGPGEGLNVTSDGSTSNESIPPIIDPAEGLNPKR